MNTFTLLFIGRGEILTMSREFEDFKQRLLSSIARGRLISQPQKAKYKYAEETIRLAVAVRSQYDTHGNLQAIAKRHLSDETTDLERFEYLEQERTRAKIHFEKLDKLVKGGWI